MSNRISGLNAIQADVGVQSVDQSLERFAPKPPKCQRKNAKLREGGERAYQVVLIRSFLYVDVFTVTNNSIETYRSEHFVHSHMPSHPTQVQGEREIVR